MTKKYSDLTPSEQEHYKFLADLLLEKLYGLAGDLKGTGPSRVKQSPKDEVNKGKVAIENLIDELQISYGTSNSDPTVNAANFDNSEEAKAKLDATVDATIEPEKVYLLKKDGDNILLTGKDLDIITDDWKMLQTEPGRALAILGLRVPGGDRIAFDWDYNVVGFDTGELETSFVDDGVEDYWLPEDMDDNMQPPDVSDLPGEGSSDLTERLQDYLLDGVLDDYLKSPVHDKLSNNMSKGTKGKGSKDTLYQVEVPGMVGYWYSHGDNLNEPLEADYYGNNTPKVDMTQFLFTRAQLEYLHMWANPAFSVTRAVN